jgi:hypothetical protein
MDKKKLSETDNLVVIFTTFWKADCLGPQGEASVRSSSHGVEYFQDPLASGFRWLTVPFLL